MNIFLISYQPGLFGEFISSSIQRHGSNFFEQCDYSVTQENRYVFPNYLAPIGVNLKTLGSGDDSYPIRVSDPSMTILNDLYGDKNICVPLHPYYRTVNTNLPVTPIRLYANNTGNMSRDIINLAFCMYWIKTLTGVYSNISSNNLLEMRNLAFGSETIHPNRALIISKLDDPNFKNWEAWALKGNILKNGQLDFDFYIRLFYNRHLNSCAFPKEVIPNYKFIDVGNIIYGNRSKLEELEYAIGGKLDTAELDAYAQINLDLLKDKTGLTLGTLRGVDWFVTFKEYCQSLN